MHCLRQWNQLLPIHCYKDTNLQLHINLIAGLILTSAVLENLTFHWKVVAIHGNVTYPWDSFNDRRSTLSISATYWWVHHYSKFTDLIPYNAPLSTFLFIINKWCVYAWNYGDILIITMARALYMRFLLRYEASKMVLEMRETVIKGILVTSKSRHLEQKFWKEIAKDHDKLMSICKIFKEFLSPLIFFSVCTNVFCVANSLYAFLVPSTPELNYNGIDISEYLLWQRVYVTWSFLHLLGRMLATFICCAKVNQYAHKSLDILDRCPNEYWTREIKRMELRLRTTNIGLTGLDYFTITKQFILNVLSVIFTFEIVLLQSSNIK